MKTWKLEWQVSNPISTQSLTRKLNKSPKLSLSDLPRYQLRTAEFTLDPYGNLQNSQGL
jgi:hypothetical protein